jgi:hypothetical protein
MTVCNTTVTRGPWEKECDEREGKPHIFHKFSQNKIARITQNTTPGYENNFLTISFMKFPVICQISRSYMSCLCIFTV